MYLIKCVLLIRDITEVNVHCSSLEILAPRIIGDMRISIGIISGISISRAEFQFNLQDIEVDALSVLELVLIYDTLFSVSSLDLVCHLTLLFSSLL